MIASGQFGTMPAIRSPGRMPSARSQVESAATCARRSANESSRRAPVSLTNTSAGAWSSRRSRFSAKFSRAPGKKRAPGMRSSARNGAQPGSPITSQNSQAARQNAARSSTDQRHRSV